MRSRRPPASRRSCVGLPAMSAQPVRRLDLTAGDADLEPAAGEMAAAVAMVVGLVGREPSVAGMTTLADRLLPTPGVTNAGSGKLRTCLLQVSPTAWFCSCQWQAADAALVCGQRPRPPHPARLERLAETNHRQESRFPVGLRPGLGSL